MKEYGRIIKIDDSFVTVEMSEEEICRECGVKDQSELKMGCRSCSLFQSTGKREINAVNRRNLALHVGDRVSVALSPSKAIKAGFLIFILPLLLFFAGYYCVAWFFPRSSEAVNIFTGFAGFFLGFLFVFIRGKLMKKKEWPEVSEIVHSDD